MSCTLVLTAWRRNGLGEIQLSVNLTAMQIEQEHFVERIIGALEASGLPADAVKLEITESTLMQDIEVIIPKLKEIGPILHRSYITWCNSPRLSSQVVFTRFESSYARTASKHMLSA